VIANAARADACAVGDNAEADGRELRSLSLPLESESSSVPSPTWRKLGELEVSFDTGEGVEIEGRWRDVGARERLERKPVVEGRRGKIVGERVEVVDGVLSTDWGLEIPCVALETRWGDGEFDGEAEETACEESPEVGYDMWECNMGSEDKPLGVSRGKREVLGDRALEEAAMAAGAEREWGRTREESDKGDSGGVGGRDTLGEAGDGVKRDLSRHHIWNTW
jgi:hypothetical protein